MARRRARVTVKGDLGAPCFAVLWTEETLPEFPDVPCVKKCLQRRKRLRSIGQQLGTKSGRRPGDGPLNNRSSTGRRVFSIPDLSNPKPGHTTGGSGRGGARRGRAGPGGAGWDGTPTGRSAQETNVPLAFQATVDSCTERPIARTSKRNPT